MCKGLNLQHAIALLLFREMYIEVWQIANQWVNACMFPLHTREQVLVLILPARKVSLDKVIISNSCFERQL